MSDQEKAAALLAAMRAVVSLEQRKLAIEKELKLARVALQEATDQASLSHA